MALFARKQKSRTELMAAADKARSKGRNKKAIAGYKEILSRDPADATVHAKVAPLLAKTGKRDESLASFEAAAQGQMKEGFTDRAVSIYVQAAECFPDERRLWDRIADLHETRDRKADAVAVLYGGAKRMTKARSRDGAIILLRRARDLDRSHLEVGLLLARLLKKAKKRDEAKGVLEALVPLTSGKSRRRVRGALFRLSPGLGTLWRWIFP